MDDVRKDMDVADTSGRFEVISKFADGERVDTRALLAALADEGGREYLIDLVAMREIVGQTTPGTPGTTGTPGTLGMPGTNTRASHRGRGMAGLAAVLAIAVGLAGYALGQQRSQIVPVAVRAPLEAEVVVALEAPPAPTQVIRLGSGVTGDGGR